MWDASVGAIGAAFVAAAVSLLGLIISKEQKVSEFRQAWIGELRSCFVDYIVELNSVVDQIRIIKLNNKEETLDLVNTYKSLNSATNGIKLRINSKECLSEELLKVMDETEKLFSSYNNITAEKVSDLEGRFLELSGRILKKEWSRVKRGELAFCVTKYISVLIFLVFLIAVLWSNFASTNSEKITERWNETCVI